MNKLIIVWLVLLGYLSFATSVMAGDQSEGKRMVGIELDVVPYIFDGYYISALIGSGHWRARIVRTDLTLPDFATQSGFEDNELSVNAYIVDYYFKKGFKGWWLSPGYEIWDGDVKQKSSGLVMSYKTDIFTFGGGYTYYLNDYLYINPWAAIHIPIAGDRELNFERPLADSKFTIKPVPEASIKVGISF